MFLLLLLQGLYLCVYPWLCNRGFLLKTSGIVKV
nr:MAG TPA: hypothetical protein [Caudoviricetes sp.]